MGPWFEPGCDGFTPKDGLDRPKRSAELETSSESSLDAQLEQQIAQLLGKDSYHSAIYSPTSMAFPFLFCLASSALFLIQSSY